MNKIAPVCIYHFQQIFWESCVMQRRTVTPEKVTKTLLISRYAIAYIYKPVCCTSILAPKEKPVLSINRWEYHPFRAHCSQSVSRFALHVFFIRKIFIRKWPSKTPKPQENVKKISSLRCLTFKITHELLIPNLALIHQHITFITIKLGWTCDKNMINSDRSDTEK